MISIPSRLPQVGTTIFSVMSALAREHQAINLSQGFPDFAADSRLLALVTEAMANGHNQYAPMTGDPTLRQAIGHMVSRQYGATYDVDQEITVVSGATEGLFCAVMALTQPGDEIIVLEPAYDSYLPGIEMAGAKAVRVPLRFPDYRIDWQQVKDHLGPRTKALMI
ncbi:MAG: aminotransferase class I/II-fold pyridoxal phosphate-dependent enzyme, partial [Bacteroidota bacterium]